MENNEMINDVNEEIVTEAVENEVAKQTFAEKHPVLYIAGVSSLIGACYVGGVYAVQGAVNGVKKLCDKIRDKREAKKAEKAKKVEGTETTVKSPDAE
jgi:hypothetical protein